MNIALNWRMTIMTQWQHTTYSTHTEAYMTLDMYTDLRIHTLPLFLSGSGDFDYKVKVCISEMLTL
jgi:hypothetical protein